MVWTAPRTWTASDTVFGADLNEQIRDNLMHCAPQLVRGNNGYIASIAENTLAMRRTHRSVTISADTRTSTSYGDLDDSVGPSVTVDTDTTCLIIFGADQRLSTAFSTHTSVAVSGATTIAADDDWCIRNRSDADSRLSSSNFMYFRTLNPGTNTFTMKYRTGDSGATGTWQRRRITAMPF